MWKLTPSNLLEYLTTTLYLQESMCTFLSHRILAKKIVARLYSVSEQHEEQVLLHRTFHIEKNTYMIKDYAIYLVKNIPKYRAPERSAGLNK